MESNVFYPWFFLSQLGGNSLLDLRKFESSLPNFIHSPKLSKTLSLGNTFFRAYGFLHPKRALLYIWREGESGGCFWAWLPWNYLDIRDTVYLCRKQQMWEFFFFTYFKPHLESGCYLSLCQGCMKLNLRKLSFKKYQFFFCIR